MSPVLNCWEIKSCKAESENDKPSKCRSCPAATDETADGINHGTNGGRICWAIAGTLCDHAATGTFAVKLATCMMCEVFIRVRDEEGEDFVTLRDDQIEDGIEHLRERTGIGFTKDP